MVGIPGFTKRLFETLASREINVILITQSSSEHSICVGIEEANADNAKKEIDKAFFIPTYSNGNQKSRNVLTVEEIKTVYRYCLSGLERAEKQRA